MGAVRTVTRLVTSEQIEQYEGLVVTTSSLIDDYVELDFDEIRQRLRLKVWRALELYKPSMGMSEGSYVFMCVMSQKKDLLKRVKRGTLYIEDIAPVDPGAQPTAGYSNKRDRFEARYLSVSPEQVYVEVEEGELELPETLSGLEKAIVRLLMDGFMQKEAAVMLHMKKGEMESTMRRIRLKLTLWRGGGREQPRRVSRRLQGVA